MKLNKIFLFLLVVAIAIIGFYLWQKNSANNTTTTINNKASTSGKIKLQYAVHWTEKRQLDGLQKYLDEYMALNPDIEFEVNSIAYNDYADKLAVLSNAGLAPDIYQIYSPWGVRYVKSGMLDKPPIDILEDVKENYISTEGVTIDGSIWGIPTEINNYSLLYNKNLFKEAGLSYPKTWTELVQKAALLTKKDSKGIITQYGIVFLKGNDWQTVDPFLSLLFSNGGQYLSSDYKKALFNSPQGVAALEAELRLFKSGTTDSNGSFFDFGKGTVAMVIAPPWTKGNFKTAFGDQFESVVGVAPFPYLTKPATLQYSWFMGVMSGSQHKAEAWNFLKWFNSDVQSSGTTRYGDLLAEVIAAIPSRKEDFASHKDILGDSFTKVYVDQMKYGVQEPNVSEAGNIKAILLKEIEAAWAGKKTAQQALDDAAMAVNSIL